MSFNGRLNPILSLSSSGSETATAMTASTLSLNSEGYFGMAAAAAASGDMSGTTAVLCERLSACQSALASKERTLRRLRAEQEEQLASLCRQMMSFECCLRRKQRELEAALGQRDRIIREQNAVIRFLMRKTGTKTRNIAKLRSEAIAKIPQLVDVTDEVCAEAATAAPTVVSIEASPNVCEGAKDGHRGTPHPMTMNRPTIPPRHQQHLTTIRLNGELSSIVESASENGGDSDSAIILDDSVSSSASASIKSNNSGSSGGSTASSSSTAANIAGPSSMSSMNASRLKRISRSVSDVVTADNDGSGQSPEPLEGCPPPGGDEDRCLESEVRSAGGRSRSRVVKLVDEEDDDLSDEYSTVEEEVDEQEQGDNDDSGSGGSGVPFDSSHYRGFLLRHGSFERYKKSAKSGTGSASATDGQGVLVTVNGGGGGGGGKVPSINHRSVTKPRDVKNRRAKLGMHGLAARGNAAGAANAAVVPNVSESIRSFVEKRGSVYKSVFLEQGPVSHSFA